MKQGLTNSKSLILGFIAIALFSINVNAQQWDTLGTVGFSDTAVLYQSLQVQSDTAYVAYADLSNANQLVVKRYDMISNSWVNIGGAIISAGGVRDVDLLVLSGDRIYVAYVDEANSQGITVMYYNGVMWSVLGNTMLPSATGAYARKPSLAYSMTSGIRIAYDTYDTVSVAPSHEIDIIVQTFNGTNWLASSVLQTTLGAAATNLNVGAPSLNINSVTNRSFIAFESFGIEVLWSNGASWDDTYSTTGRFASNANFSSFCDLEFAPNGDMYVAFSDAANDGKTTVSMFDGTAWVTVGNVGFTASKASYIDLDFDSNGSPYVAQQDTASTGVLGVSVYKYDGSGWGDIGSGNVYAYTGSKVSYTNLVIDDNTAYLSFTNEDNKSTVLRYVLSVAVTQIPTLNQEINVYPNPTDNQLTIEGVDNIAVLRILTMDGKAVQTITTNKNIISVENLPHGIYTIEVVTEEGVGYKQFVKK